MVPGGNRITDWCKKITLPQGNVIFFLTAGNLEDAHLLELAQKITDEKELQHLGLKILKIRANIVDSALTNKRDIRDAALEVLKTWYHNQESRQEVYRKLYTELVNNGRQLWANELKQSVTGTVDLKPLCEDRKYSVKASFIFDRNQKQNRKQIRIQNPF